MLEVNLSFRLMRSFLAQVLAHPAHRNREPAPQTPKPPERPGSRLKLDENSHCVPLVKSLTFTRRLQLVVTAIYTLDTYEYNVGSSIPNAHIQAA